MSEQESKHIVNLRHALEQYEMVYAEYCRLALPAEALSPSFELVQSVVGNARKVLAECPA
jgi:hypothetical protein